MTTHDPSIHGPQGPDPTPPLDADLMSLVHDLDRLGALDRAAAAPGLEDHLFRTTLASLHGIETTTAQAAELGSIDRASAPRDLEEHVYQASAPAIREHAEALPRLILHTASDSRDARRHVRVAWWNRAPLRIAAAIALFAGATIAVRSNISSTHTSPDLDRVKGDMDTLFAAMESRTTGETSETTDTQTDELATWLLDGAAS